MSRTLRTASIAVLLGLGLAACGGGGGSSPVAPPPAAPPPPPPARLEDNSTFGAVFGGIFRADANGSSANPAEADMTVNPAIDPVPVV